MDKILVGVDRIMTQAEYELLSKYIELYTHYAIDNGFLKDDNPDNEVRKELGRLTRLGGQYEKEFMSFPFGKDTPLVHAVKVEMFKRGLKQKDVADILEVPESSLSRFLRGQTKVSFDLAKKLYGIFKIDPDLIFS